jgi:hypothetical protein
LVLRKHAVGLVLGFRRGRGVVVAVAEEEVQRSGRCMCVGCLLGGWFLVGRARRALGGRDHFHFVMLAEFNSR